MPRFISDHSLALIGATAWAYAAALAVVAGHLSYIGPCAAGFVICLFVAQTLEGCEG